MAQRALGTLPAVRPPMAPRYTETSRPPSAEHEMTAEIETVAPIAARKNNARKQQAVDGDREAQVQQDIPIGGRKILHSSTTPKRLQNAPAQEMQVSAPADRDEQQLPLIGRVAQPAVERGRQFVAEHPEAARPEAERVDAETRPAEDAHRSQAAPVAKATPHLDRMEPQRDDANAEPTREPRESSESASALVPKSAPSRPEIAGNSDSPKSIRSLAPPPLQIDRRTTLREPRPEPLAEERTEIHISIGSIELRAPHVESRPQAAPFRPRVTLDDFLRRGQETRP
jgi:hypothetical protein